eukprot:tig00001333_g8193.t1
MAKPVMLGYWAIRGLAQPIRFILAYTKTPFEERRYVQGDAPGFSRDDWLSEKEQFALAFPNLPYLIDPNTDVKLTQSNAIMRYIARKHDLLGKNEAEQIRVDLLAEESMDFRNQIVRLCYNPSYESLRGDFFKTYLPTELKKLHDFLGERPWFAGDNLTFIDFIMYELLDQMRLMQPDSLDAFPKLGAYLTRFEALPAIAEYMKSPEFIQRPVNNKVAQWK